MFKNVKYFLALIIAGSALLYSCGSSQSASSYAECVKPAMKSFVIRWGRCIKEASDVKGYELRPDGSIYTYRGLLDSTSEFVAKTESSNFCKYFQMMSDTMRKIPTLNAPGDFNQFVEVQNREKKFYFRAIWVPEFKTSGSYCYRVIYDSLATLLENAKLNKKK